MDVPVALALLLAWLPSVFNTLRAERRGVLRFGRHVHLLPLGRPLRRDECASSQPELLRGAGAQPARAGDAAVGGRQSRTRRGPRAGRRRPVPGAEGRSGGGGCRVARGSAGRGSCLARRIADHRRVRGRAARRGRTDSRRQREPGLAAHSRGDRDGGGFDTGLDGAAAGARAGHAPAHRAGRRSCGFVVRRPSSWCWR